MSDHKFFKATLPEEIVSRGTGAEIPLREVTEFDVMPQLIGSAYLYNETLQPRVHFLGKSNMPYLAEEAAYKTLAEAELQDGNLDEAIDAYRLSLSKAVGWVSAVGAMTAGGRHALFSQSEIDNFDFESKFRHLEGSLVEQIWQGEVTFEPIEYTAFVATVRQQRKRELQLNQIFFMGKSEAYETLEAPQKRDPEIGEEYVELLIAMHRFKDAAWIAGELSQADRQAELEAREESEGLRMNPRFQSLIDAEMDIMHEQRMEKWMNSDD